MRKITFNKVEKIAFNWELNTPVFSIMGNTLMANNMKYTDDADHPLDIYYVIK